MITFMPVPDYKESARILDYRRLGKQRVEALMILRILDRSDRHASWKHHPAVRIWRGYESSLQRYTMAMCKEWIERGYRSTIVPEIETFEFEPGSDPFWLGLPKFHLSHQSNLLRKNYGHYSQYFIGKTDLPYYWPKHNE